ncbi:MAG: SulP family inorganic anion transporter [Pseudobdellovibrionaceae bacterium]
MNRLRGNWFANVKSDFPASLVVFLIALPLSLGIALASGAPMKAGIISAAIGGIVVGTLAGAPLQVSGPAAGLSVMVLGFIQKFGFETTCLITLIAGVTQIIFGMLGAAQLAFVISPAVIHAMLAGIGILIALGQIHVLFGFAPKSSAIMNIVGYSDSFLNMNTSAALLGVFSLIVLLSWNKWGQKKFSFIPGSLIAVIAGTVLSTFLHADVPHVQLNSQLFDGFSGLKLGDNSLVQLIISGLGLALVASAESLLCAVATDKLHDGPRVKLGKELIAQGVGNSLAGLVGGLPITGVIVRSSANVSAGAKSKLSAILHGAWILVFAMFFTPVLNQIPLSVLAALLIYTGVKLVKIAEVKKLMAFQESIVYFATLFGVVFINLLWGIGIGFGLATVMMIQHMIRFHFHSEKINDNNKQVRVKISGNLTFLSVPKLLKQLNTLPKKSEIHLSMDVDHIDHAVVEALHDWKQSYEKDGGVVFKDSLVDLWKNLKRPDFLVQKNGKKYLTPKNNSISEISL